MKSPNPALLVINLVVLLQLVAAIPSAFAEGAGLSVRTDAAGQVGLAYRGQPRLDGLQASFYREAGNFSTGAAGSAAGAATEQAGADAVGAYRETITPFATPAGVFRRHVRVYPEQAMALLSVSFAETVTDFAPERSVSLDVTRVPGFTHGLLFSVEKNPMAPVTAPRELFAQFPRDINQVGNRKITDLNWMPRGGNYFLWEETDGVFVAAIPLNGDGCRGWIGNDQPTPGLQFGGAVFDRNHALRKVDLALVVFGDDPHALTSRGYKAALHLMEASGRLREEKQYPEVFEYLGWCTWEAFRQNINADKIRQAAQVIAQKGVPVRWALIDDGWQSVAGRKMTGFAADPQLFPGGLKPLIRDLKHTGRIEWVGVWHTLMGYWDGIDPDSELGRRFAGQLVRAEDGVWLPAPGAGAFAFFEAWHRQLRADGVDFVKVDDQTHIGLRSRNLAPIDTAGAGLIGALEASAALHMDTVLNCMAMGTQCAYHWGRSAIVRVSLDYRANDAPRSRLALTNGLYNPLWLANFCWPDADMFYSSEKYAPIHAMARAISGGPIYLSDPPEKIDAARVRSLCLGDGRILRADVPALPTRDSLFIDPMRDPVLLKAATLAHGTGVLGLFNLYEKDAPLARSYSSSDLPAGATPAGRHYVYSHAGQRGVVARAGEELSSPTLAPLESDLVIFAPLVDGVAVVGLADKLLSPAGVAAIRRGPGAMEIDLRDDGEFLAYVEHPGLTVRLDGRKQTGLTLTDGCVRFDTTSRADKSGPPTIRLEWKP